MIRPSRIAIAMAGALSALSATAAVSQTTDAASEPPATPLPSISVKASANASPTSLGSEALKRRLDQTVGSVGFVDAASYTNSYAFTLRDVLKDAPGVFVENRYGQELRLSIRGSGIARGYHARGLDILQDGIPTNLADGSGDKKHEEDRPPAGAGGGGGGVAAARGGSQGAGRPEALGG
ncbi:Plug domain-containing protein, partial [Burkholderia gladioli]|uniref:Plug domain-containing protein n=1 Tax=Burkholderia gladioli TaxID=28095 RepID=UPI002158EE38